MVAVRLDDMLVQLLWVKQWDDRGVLEEADAFRVGRCICGHVGLRVDFFAAAGLVHRPLPRLWVYRCSLSGAALSRSSAHEAWWC